MSNYVRHKFFRENLAEFLIVIILFLQVNETVENKALARLACHKSVHQKVLEFREKFPDWKKSLLLLLESLGEKYKNKKHTPVVSKKKERKLNLTRKNNNSVDKEDLKVPNTHRAASIKSSSGLWTVATCESEDADSKHRESVNTNDEADFIPGQSSGLANTSNSDEPSDEDFESKGKQIKTFVDAEKSKLKTKKPQVSDKNVKTESSTEIFSKENISNKLSSLVPHDISNESISKLDLKKLQVSNRNVGTESSIKSVSKKVMETQSISAPLKSAESNKIPDNISNSIPEVAADSFFITRDNKEYLSISAKPIVDTEKSQVKEARRMNPQSKSERFPANAKQFKPKSNQNNSFGKRKNFDSTRGKPGDTKNALPAPSLHPSWIAKKKQSTIIQTSQFQGKKIKFDD